MFIDDIIRNLVNSCSIPMVKSTGATRVKLYKRNPSCRSVVGSPTRSLTTSANELKLVVKHECWTFDTWTWGVGKKNSVALPPNPHERPYPYSSDKEKVQKAKPPSQPVSEAL
ncbi:Uncharacterized protein Fot_33225 [Forsythia ovata]|uniref:Uncharacterized protein n=1 Tax=Forsythia ovata TaxID=205694 RepID=A0ABD1TA20_9LAMI